VFTLLSPRAAFRALDFTCWFLITSVAVLSICRYYRRSLRQLLGQHDPQLSLPPAWRVCRMLWLSGACRVPQSFGRCC